MPLPVSLCRPATRIANATPVSAGTTRRPGYSSLDEASDLSVGLGSTGGSTRNGATRGRCSRPPSPILHPQKTRGARCSGLPAQNIPRRCSGAAVIQTVPQMPKIAASKEGELPRVAPQNGQADKPCNLVPAGLVLRCWTVSAQIISRS